MSLYPTRSELVPAGLPFASEVIAEGRKIGRTATLGTSLFLKEKGFSSEVEYKQYMVAQGKIMFHGIYGLDSVPEQCEGAKRVYEELNRRKARLDRWTIIIARPMGLPPEMRRRVPKETGLMLDSPEEWVKVANIVPIHPHIGDHIIGSPASVENLLCALAAGLTSCGNFAEYFSFDYPGWYDDVQRAIVTVKALGMMAELKDKGRVISSNLDDGFSNLFSDRVNYIGWGMLEKYIVEDLIGADLKHLFGNVVTDPRTRLVLIRAIDEIHGGETAGTFVNGNTVYTQDAEKNVSILTTCLLFDIIGQLKKPTGHAVHAVPLTEHDRIPSPEEIAQVAVISNQMEEEAHKVADLVDFEEIDRMKQQLIAGGRVFRDRVLKGLAEIGVNVKDPIELMIALKRIGGRRLEELFGVGQKDEAIPGGRRPVIPTQIFHHTQAIADQIKQEVHSKLSRNLKGKKVLLLTSDVHEYAKMVIGIALKEAGVEVIDLGQHVDPEQIVQALLKTKVDGVCISTHNGMALSYARKLLEEMERYNLKTKIFMGGRLNELTGDILPRDVTADLRELKIITCNDVFDVLENL